MAEATERAAQLKGTASALAASEYKVRRLTSDLKEVKERVAEGKELEKEMAALSLRLFAHGSLERAAHQINLAIPKQRCYADGPCIFNLPKKARFAAEHGLYVDGDLAGSELDVSTL
eukprot:jgi/Chrpa1/24506/Chrysochromulina_OHIO_Genome00023797-RA